jgi:hypothetical protein
LQGKFVLTAKPINHGPVDALTVGTVADPTMPVDALIVVLQVPRNKADAEPCERLQMFLSGRDCKAGEKTFIYGQFKTFK